jgi:hypothetical protein
MAICEDATRINPVTIAAYFTPMPSNELTQALCVVVPARLLSLR